VDFIRELLSLDVTVEGEGACNSRPN